MTESSSHSSATGTVLASGLVTAIDHVGGVAVPDLDAALVWYAENLGLVSTHEELNEEQGVREAMLSVPGSPPEGSTAIQLLAPLNENSTIAKFLDRSGPPGLQQLAYRVTDLDAISTLLREQGVRLLYDAPRRGTADSRINFLHPKAPVACSSSSSSRPPTVTTDISARHLSQRGIARRPNLTDQVD